MDVGSKGEAWIDRVELMRRRRRAHRGRGRRDRGDGHLDAATTCGCPTALQRRARRPGESLALAADSGVPVEGKVAGVVKGGYQVTVGGLRAFCPFSQMDVRRVEVAEDMIGRVL